MYVCVRVYAVCLSIGTYVFIVCLFVGCLFAGVFVLSSWSYVSPFVL